MGYTRGNRVRETNAIHITPLPMAKVGWCLNACRTRQGVRKAADYTILVVGYPFGVYCKECTTEIWKVWNDLIGEEGGIGVARRQPKKQHSCGLAARLIASCHMKILTPSKISGDGRKARVSQSPGARARSPHEHNSALGSTRCEGQDPAPQRSASAQRRAKSSLLDAGTGQEAQGVDEARGARAGNGVAQCEPISRANSGDSHAVEKTTARAPRYANTLNRR